MLSTQQQQKAIGALLQKKENSLCADCSGKSPCWVSLDFGVFICMNCSGAHRALGPSITRVRSTKLDTWNRDWLQNMKIGNSILNQYWENQLVGINRTSKPNINTSLNDIIKFVQDKYIKKKYVDPNQPLDPLKRSKLPPKKNEQIIQPKQIPTKILQDIPNPHIKNGESPFNAFNTIINNKQKALRKPSDNLISFQKQSLLQDSSKNSQPQQPRYNHNQFHTISGSKPKEADNLINFQVLGNKNNNETNQNKTQTQTHNNYWQNNNANHYHNTGHYSVGHFNNQIPNYNPSVPQYDKAQYVTMNINMNMYPKVMNINMNPQTTNNYLPPQSNQATTNINLANQFLGQPSSIPQKQPQNEVKITLDSNINLNNFSQEKKQESKSWIDEWK